MLPLGNQHLYLRQILGLAVGLHCGTHGVLEILIKILDSLANPKVSLWLGRYA